MHLHLELLFFVQRNLFLLRKRNYKTRYANISHSFIHLVKTEYNGIKFKISTHSLIILKYCRRYLYEKNVAMK